MRKKQYYPKPKRFSAAEQYMFLSKSKMLQGSGSVRKGELIWIFYAQPTPLSRIYQIKIVFDGRSPNIFALTPSLIDVAKGKKIPHLYSQREQKLCLYRPKYNQWNPSKKLIDTIVPWTFLWLFYFEIWLTTGEWKGGGEEPK